MDSEEIKIKEVNKMDALGDRMKKYERCSRHFLPRRSYTIIRIDQKAGHTYTRSLKKPFDEDYINSFDFAAWQTIKEISGAQFAYTQSDECSILVTDLESVKTEAWFDNNLQKLASVSASIFTAEFNNRHCRYASSSKLAYFDARVFQIPDREEVGNYFVWRNQDCYKNCISGYAQAHYSSKDLLNKTTAERLHMLVTDQKVAIPDSHKYGRIINDSMGWSPYLNGWKFTEDREKLMKLIPERGY